MVLFLTLFNRCTMNILSHLGASIDANVYLKLQILITLLTTKVKDSKCPLPLPQLHWLDGLMKNGDASLHFYETPKKLCAT